jgi:CDP-diacylglycerol---glycerol-3-phosphate 3-phosphatidyltransferase
MAISLDKGPVEPTPADASGAGATSEPTLSRHALHPAPDAASNTTRPASESELFWNLPNTITLLRAAVVPVLLFLPVFDGETGSAVIAWIFIVAAVSDLVDGWLARRGQMVTHIGKLLDPLADKLLVSTALIVLLAMGRIPLWATWMVVVIVGRELAVTGLRGIASAGGQVVAASGLGKLKAVSQNIAVGALLFHFETLGLDANLVGLVWLLVATVLTLTSGYLYFRNYFRSLAEGSRRAP